MSVHGATPEARVRNLHQQYLPAAVDYYCCGHCNMIGAGYVSWPCDTIQALDAKEDDRVPVHLPKPHEDGKPVWLVGALKVALTTEGVFWPGGEYGSICEPFWAEELGLALVAAARATKEKKYDDSKLPNPLPPPQAIRVRPERRRQRNAGDGRRYEHDEAQGRGNSDDLRG
jgi:hypothetical protein